MSGIRYTPPAGGAGVTPDLDQVLTVGNIGYDKQIALIGNTDTNEGYYKRDGIEYDNNGFIVCELIPSNSVPGFEVEGSFNFIGSNLQEQFKLETTLTDGGSVTVSIDVLNKLRIWSDRFEVFFQNGLATSAIGTFLFDTLTVNRNWLIRDRDGTIAFTDELPQDTGWVNLSLQPGFTAFNSSSYRHRVYGKVCTISLTGTVNGTISIVANVNITGAVPTSLGIDYTGADTNKISISSSGQIIITTSTGGNVTAGTLVNAFFTYIIAG